MIAKSYDVAVVGAGSFGAWTAYHLQRAGQRVILLDAYGPANSRASSGGESRVIRVGYGTNEIYSRWAMRALELWQEFFERSGQPLFHNTGVLWLGRDQDTYIRQCLATLEKLGVPHEPLTRPDLEKRYPQFHLGTITWGLFEPRSGVLMARRAVQAVVQEAMRRGMDYLPAAVASPSGRGRVEALATLGGDAIRAGIFVFACGPWLPQVFPEPLEGRILPTLQEVVFFGVHAGDKRFAPPALPAWMDPLGDEAYGIPDLEARGLKIGLDRHGPLFDPETGSRTISPEGLRAARQYLAKCFPALKDAPVLETRVCQYENTSTGDFLIDRHPGFENVWLVGGGSGHGFKHGPSVGEYVAEHLMTGGAIEPRFTLATKAKVKERAVY